MLLAEAVLQPATRRRNLHIMLKVFTSVGGHFVVCLYMTLQTGWTLSIFRLEFSFGCFPAECAELRLSETN